MAMNCEGVIKCGGWLTFQPKRRASFSLVIATHSLGVFSSSGIMVLLVLTAYNSVL